MTNKRNKIFQTPVGTFSYKYLENSKYSVGIERIPDETGSFLIASKEKAICDRLAMIKDVNSKEIIHQLALLGLWRSRFYESARFWEKKREQPGNSPNQVISIFAGLDYSLFF